jgi:hypothetical protein
MRLVGANAAAQVTGLEELPGKSNYFIGNDSTKWRTGIPNYAKVKYANVYPGIDFVYYGRQPIFNSFFPAAVILYCVRPRGPGLCCRTQRAFNNLWSAGMVAPGDSPAVTWSS